MKAAIEQLVRFLGDVLIVFLWQDDGLCYTEHGTYPNN